MSRPYFISDLHFGHRKVIEFEDNWRAKVLDVSSIEEHDDTLVRRINSVVKKRDILFILGDLGFSFERINDIKCEKRIHLGNHDGKSVLEYANLNHTKIMPCMGYKGNWISHIPIHPQEFYKKKLNIHGHVHSNVIPDERYVNLSIESTCGWPIPYEYIRDGKFVTHNLLTPKAACDQIRSLGYFDLEQQTRGT